MDKALLEKWREQCEAEDRENELAIVAVGQPAPPSSQVLQHPMVQEILRIFEENQILIQPTLYRLREMRQRVAEATLKAVFTPEEFEALRQRAIASEQEKS